MAVESSIGSSGFELFPGIVDDPTMARLRETLFRAGVPGERCLLDEPVVREAAIAARERLVSTGRLRVGSVAIQAIAFDKTVATNWKVTWHQDLMFPFARPVSSDGFDLRTKKDGVDYARPSRPVLEDLLAVRIHLDDCDESNGPLRVSPATHRLGVVPSARIATTVAQHGEHTCLARAGEALLMRPLLLHASSRATAPKHRRVLHLVYYAGIPISEDWHRTV